MDKYTVTITADQRERIIYGLALADIHRILHGMDRAYDDLGDLFSLAADGQE